MNGYKYHKYIEKKMKLKQLSLFLENKPGHIRSTCRTLADAGINIETMSLADTEQFGILRLLLKEWERAKEVFEAKGVVVAVTEVVSVMVDDKPGGLADVLDIIDEAGLNIEYMYGFSGMGDNKAGIVFRFDNPDLAIKHFEEKGVKIVGNKELFGT